MNKSWSYPYSYSLKEYSKLKGNEVFYEITIMKYDIIIHKKEYKTIWNREFLENFIKCYEREQKIKQIFNVKCI